MAQTTKDIFNLSEHNRTVLGYLVRPSWLSGLIAVVVSLAIVISVIIASHYSGSTLQTLFDARRSTPNASVSSTSATVNNHFSTNVIVSDAPLLVFWAGVGLIVYSLAANLVNALSGAVDLEEELRFVNLDRHELIRQALTRLAIRAAILLLWLAFMNFTAHSVLPYVISLARVSTNNRGMFVSFSYPLAAIILMTISIHLHTIFLRLLLFRPRVFWQSAYD